MLNVLFSFLGATNRLEAYACFIDTFMCLESLGKHCDFNEVANFTPTTVFTCPGLTSIIIVLIDTIFG